MAEPAQSNDRAIQALERLLTWPEIARSPQLAKFLDYIVRRKLEGQEQAIKAYAIAVDVLGRPADFDPQADPIVRVQARRLRALLDQYYLTDGAAETLRIRLPVGRYVPELVEREEALPPLGEPEPLSAMPALPAVNVAKGDSFGVSWFALMMLVAGVLVLSLALVAFWPRDSVEATGDALDRPSLTVVEFQTLGGLQGFVAPSGGLAIELVTDLELFDELIVRYGGGGDAATMGDAATDYVLTGIVRPDGDMVQFSAILTDVNSGLVVWNQSIAETAQAATQPGVLDDVSRQLSLRLGSARGPLHRKAQALLDEAQLPDGPVTDYLCTMMFHRYRDTAAQAAAELVQTCLAKLHLQGEPSAAMLAIEASLIVDRLGTGNGDRFASPVSISRAEVLLNKALQTDPTSAFVWEQLARTRLAAGATERARAAFSSSLQLNPANADALAAYGLQLALSGEVGDAAAMAQDALDSTADPPDWYFGAPALEALRQGKPELAAIYAESYSRADRELGPILAIMAGQRAADPAIVNRYVAQVLEVPAFRVAGVLPRLRERISDPALIEQARIALLAAGVPQASLVNGF